jgi:hypothetical protein
MERQPPARRIADEHPMNNLKTTKWKFDVECSVLNVYLPLRFGDRFSSISRFQTAFSFCSVGGLAV